MKLTNKYISDLINQGEHQQLDFKFEISDSKKIARTLAAFSNTDGGKLLIGVKDNGSIAGIRSEEEFHMLEAAAQMYCRPKIHFEAKEWNIDGKHILEISIPKNENELTKAPTPDEKWLIYVRVKDQNLLANPIFIKVWKKRKLEIPTKVEYTETESKLLNYLSESREISLGKFCRIASIPKYKAEKILIDFILLNIIEMVFTEKRTYYKLVE